MDCKEIEKFLPKALQSEKEAKRKSREQKRAKKEGRKKSSSVEEYLWAIWGLESKEGAKKRPKDLSKKKRNHRIAIEHNEKFSKWK